MKNLRIVLSSAAFATLLSIAPYVASAQTIDLSGSTGVFINPSGAVQVMGAAVSSVGNGVINAVTTLGNTAINWVINTSAATKIDGSASANASTTDIHVGDKIGFAGSISSSVGSSITVAASRIRDFTVQAKLNTISGNVQSIDSANGSLVIKDGKRTMTVRLSAGAKVTLDGASSTLSSLHNGEQVKAVGTLSADKTTLTASEISAHSLKGNAAVLLNLKNFLAQFHFGR